MRDRDWQGNEMSRLAAVLAYHCYSSHSKILILHVNKSAPVVCPTDLTEHVLWGVRSIKDVTLKRFRREMVIDKISTLISSPHSVESHHSKVSLLSSTYLPLAASKIKYMYKARNLIKQIEFGSVFWELNSCNCFTC